MCWMEMMSDSKASQAGHGVFWGVGLICVPVPTGLDRHPLLLPASSTATISYGSRRTAAVGPGQPGQAREGPFDRPPDTRGWPGGFDVALEHAGQDRHRGRAPRQILTPTRLQLSNPAAPLARSFCRGRDEAERSPMARTCTPKFEKPQTPANANPPRTTDSLPADLLLLLLLGIRGVAPRRAPVPRTECAFNRPFANQSFIHSKPQKIIPPPPPFH